MLKYLLLILIAAIVWRAWLKPSKRQADAPRSVAPPERMVACAQCGLLMPESDSLAEDGRHYCCEAHRPAARPHSR